ncbi:glycosyltransferase family 2 protein, partial [Actinocorallia lasiicapitis]
MTAPDVTVVVSVYNTLPYLEDCLDSLLTQSIGPGRMEIVAVDDGSTDGSGELLDRTADKYPDVLTVVHQENSGGPAAPSNRALDLARGRYVFFVGADDRLGPEALERMVRLADERDADVVAGRVIGVNDRYVHQTLFDCGREEVGLAASPLAWSLANTKLFRREFVERHGLRFPEDLPVGSDQPFTIEACFRAGRVSVLSDYTCYYAVRRVDAGNMTYQVSPVLLLDCTERLLDFTAALIPPSVELESIRLRHFSWEVAKVFRHGFLELDQATQEQVCARTAALMERHLTPETRAKIKPLRRLRLTLAEQGDVAALVAAIRAEATGAPPRQVLSDGRVLAVPAFVGAIRPDLPESCFTLPGATHRHIAQRIAPPNVEFAPRALALTVAVDLVGDRDGRSPASLAD